MTFARRRLYRNALINLLYLKVTIPKGDYIYDPYQKAPMLKGTYDKLCPSTCCPFAKGPL